MRKGSVRSCSRYGGAPRMALLQTAISRPMMQLATRYAKPLKVNWTYNKLQSSSNLGIFTMPFQCRRGPWNILFLLQRWKRSRCPSYVYCWWLTITLCTRRAVGRSSCPNLELSWRNMHQGPGWGGAFVSQILLVWNMFLGSVTVKSHDMIWSIDLLSLYKNWMFKMELVWADLPHCDINI